MTDKLLVYNGALNAMRETPLVSLTENRSARRTLDAFYEQAIKFCLEQEKWTFATRFSELKSSNSVTPNFGYKYFFDKPSDYKNLVGIWSDGYMYNGLGFDYDDDKSGWLVNIDTIYVKYISDDIGYGLDLNKWTAAFLLYVQRYLASLTAGTITQSRVTEADLKEAVKEAKIEAMNANSQGKPALRIPTGSWIKSRHGNYSPPYYYRDR